MIDAPVDYARSGDLRIAYQTFGDGPVTLVQVPGTLNNIEAGWEIPSLVRFYEGLTAFARVILLDKRGTGLSDRLQPGAIPSLEDRADDVGAVMEAARVDRAALLGIADGGAPAILFAARAPERSAALILRETGARAAWAPGNRWGVRAEDFERFVPLVEARWGHGLFADFLGRPERYRAQYARIERLAGTPSVAIALLRSNMATDVRAVLPSIQVPTLVVQNPDQPIWPVAGGRYLAEHISGAKYAEVRATTIPGFPDEDTQALVGVIEEFLTGARQVTLTDRVLKTVLFTDIVDSTRRAVELGDRRWKELLDAHETVVRAEVERAGGYVVNTTGDGFLAAFDGPARAIRGAQAVVGRADGLELEVRAGLHTGECEVRGDDLAGIAVHIGARVAALAGPGEVLVTSTVRDLVAGSGLDFADRGRHELRGVPGEWQVLAAKG